MHAAARVLAAAAVAGAGSCAPAGYAGPAPEARWDRVLARARAGDRGAVPELVEALDSDDPAVRLTAFLALRRLTDRSFGYCPSAPADERAEAVRRWAEALRDPGALHSPRPGPAADG